jgi:putative hydrolase of the HAD superfamily
VDVGGRLAGAVLALDVDGVLVDPERGGRGRWQAELEQRLGIAPAELDAFFFRRSWPDVVLGRTLLEDALAAVAEERGWVPSPEEIIRCWLEADSHLHEDVVAAAARWSGAGAVVVLATSQEHRRAAFVAELVGGALPIAHVLYSAALGAAKPDPAFFEAASAVLGASADGRVVFVDDLVENVEAGRAHGWTSIHFRHQPGWEQEVEAALVDAAAGVC